MKQKLFFYLIVLLAAFIISPSITLAQDFPDVCQQPENLLPNCNFNNGLDHWQTYLLSGAANFSVLQGGGGCHAPLCPAAYMVTDSHFVGGIYQQMPAAAGNTYYANMVWLTIDSLVNDASVNKMVGGIGRSIGIDPLGGTDPSSSNIVWADNWRNDCKICDNQVVTATAQADKITIFVKIDDTWRLRAADKGLPIPPTKDQFWLDDLGLKQVAGSAVPVATPTQLPATDTPPAPTSETKPPTSTPEIVNNMSISPTTISTETAQAVLTPTVSIISPLPTPTAPGAAPPPTLTPTSTPSPTSTPDPAQPTPTHQPRPLPTRVKASSWGSPEGLGLVGTVICVGGAVLVVLAVILAGLIWLYRLGWGQSADDESAEDVVNDEDDDPDAIEVEIVKE